MNIAVVGSGISGLVCAYLLSRDHELTVFEAGDHVGGHTNTVEVERKHGRYAIDTGFIVFNRSNYPNFTRLLDRLGVESQKTSMSFSVRCEATGVEYNGTSLNALFAQRRNLLRPSFWRMVGDILRFGREAPRILEERDDAFTVADYRATSSLGEEFFRHYLVPLGSALWSCPASRFYRFPMRFVVEFLDNHAMLQVGGRPEWRVIRGGSHRYVEALTREFRDRIRLRSPVRSVRRSAGAAHVAWLDGGRERLDAFDHVIFACHSDQALALVADPSDAEREILGAFPYGRNDVALHTDTSILPRRRPAWASWNYNLRADSEAAATATYNMNILQGLDAPEVFCVTLNEEKRIDPAKVLRRFVYHHPFFTTGRSRAQARHRELIDTNRTSYCGAYWGYGFHEDGVNSALAVCRALGKDLSSAALSEAREGAPGLLAGQTCGVHG